MAEFNSRQYQFSDIQVVIKGRTITGLRGIKYKVSQDKEVVYGAGNKGQFIQRGNISYDGEISLLQNELLALERYAREEGFEGLHDLQLNIVVAYAPETGLPLTTDVIRGVEFTSVDTGMSQGDKMMEVTLPFIALDIKKG
ncbi:MAG: hypothetical protein N4A72_10830 [Bacteroidales bacterium]|jgi:hypothetical protein|nr:hypothetical protein [Bacteroidales bacterium]